jgi:hypothetical protein
MQRQIRDGAVALVLLLASVGFAAAAGNDWVASNDRVFLTYAQQRRLVLNGAQEQVIFRSVSKQNGKKETAPPGFKAEIGQVVPKSITLHRLPTDATNHVWAVKPYDYAMLQNQLLIVNPKDRIVDDIITQ